jgi:hypothetical protein
MLGCTRISHSVVFVNYVTLKLKLCNQLRLLLITVVHATKDNHFGVSASAMNYVLSKL